MSHPDSLANALYRYQVNYTKRFLSGGFFGDRLRFCDWQSADDFVKLCRSGKTFGTSGYGPAYKVEDPQLIAI
jgi:hypothetical protein